MEGTVAPPTQIVASSSQVLWVRLGAADGGASDSD